MSYLYVKWNSFGLRSACQRFRHESMVCFALAAPVAKTCGGGGGALRSERRKWPAAWNKELDLS
jgi:hypothetical protein